jgi:hypothetical protein
MNGTPKAFVATGGGMVRAWRPRSKAGPGAQPHNPGPLQCTIPPPHPPRPPCLPFHPFSPACAPPVSI